VPATEDEYRLRLEGRAELLEAARLRYRALVLMLRSLRWKSRLRKNASLLQETAAAQPAVDEALAAATKRAKAELWPSRAPMTRCLDEVWTLRAALTQVAQRRLSDFERSRGPVQTRAPGRPVAALKTPRGRRFLAAMDAAARHAPRGNPAGASTAAAGRPPGLAPPSAKAPPAEDSLAALLSRLETDVVAAARTVLPGQRWATALEVLPSSLPEVRRAAGFGAWLEPLFGRPRGPEDQLPFDVAQARALAARWAEGEAALAQVWEHLAALDRTGSLVRYLQRRSRRAPLHAPSSGPEEMLHAEFWHGVALARLRELATERFGPVEAAESELLDLVAYACEREGDERARLPANGRMSDARAGLFELAYELWHGLKNGAATSRPRPERGLHWPLGTWERLAERARRADGGGPSADSVRLRDSLRMFIHIRSQGSGRQPADGPLYRTLGLALNRAAAASADETDGLADLVEQARALAEVPPLRSGD